MAMVFQSYALYPHMTVRENMAFPLKLARLPGAEISERVAQAAAVLGLDDLLDRRPAALSGGQRQRVAMGRAIVRQPAAFLMDEPLSNLDAKLRVQMRIELSRLQRRLGTTTVYVTHDQTEAMTLGDRVAVLNRGEVQQVGTPRELYREPANLFVAGFIGSPAMNLLPARVEADRLVLPMTELPLPARLSGTGAAGPRHCVAGIRPEHIGEPGRGGEGTFRTEVVAVEWLGADLYLQFEVAVPPGEQLSALQRELLPESFRDERLRLTARLGADRTLAAGEAIDLAVDPEGIILFDGDTGVRIYSNTDGP
jgi:multiple sugar transport system ATP-binding protein